MTTPTETPESTRRRWADRLADLLCSGPLVGALLAVAACVFGLLSLDNLSYFGHQSEELKQLAIQIYGIKVAAEQAKLLALYVAVGLLGGLCSSGYLALWDHLRGRGPSSRLWTALRHALLLGAIHLAILARSVIAYPQMYAEDLFDRGGVRRAMQVWLTTWMSPALVEGLTALLLVAPLVVAAGLRLRRSGIGVGALRDLFRPRVLALGGLVVALLGAAATAVVLASAPRPARDNDGPNVLILAVDSLRADRVQRPEYRRVAPHLHALADRSVQFTQAYGTLARTFPSWTTLLTGREPHDHGIRHMFPTWEARRRVGPTLVRHLREGGWRTAVVSDYAGEIFSRFQLGFHHVDVSTFSFYEIIRQRVLKAHLHLMPYLTSDLGRPFAPLIRGLPENADPMVLARRVNRMLDRLGRSKRFFLVAFFSSSHFPYAAPYPWYQRFTSPRYAGPFRYHKQRLLNEKPPSAADVRHIRGLFDGSVGAGDAAIGAVLAHLERLGLSQKTIVVITADHGENLFEADLDMGHGDHLRGDRATRLPLLIHDPVNRLPARRVDAIVRDVDLAPTVAALVRRPLRSATGESLVPLIQGQVADRPDRAAFMETGLWFTEEVPGVGKDQRLPYPPVLGGLVTLDQKRGGDLVLNPDYEEYVVAAKHRAIRTREWKLIYVPLADGVRHYLYDVRRDPDCQRDLARERPDVARALAARLVHWMRGERGSVEVGRYVLPGTAR